MQLIDSLITKKNAIFWAIVIVLMGVIKLPFLVWTGLLSLILFSLITPARGDKIFKLWRNFTLGWCAFFIILLLIPNNNFLWQNLGVNINFPSLNIYIVTVFAVWAYALISLVIVIVPKK
jgi:hypothetical protein